MDEEGVTKGRISRFDGVQGLVKNRLPTSSWLWTGLKGLEVSGKIGRGGGEEGAWVGGLSTIVLKSPIPTAIFCYKRRITNCHSKDCEW